MLNESDLTQLTPQERVRLAHALAALDAHPPAVDGRAQRRRWVVVAASVGAALVLAVWIGVLAMTLPRYYRAGGWRVAWVGFDIGLLVVFALTAWAAWRRRQMLILCLIVLATMLCCDAWFDITLDWHTGGFLASLLLGVLVELPVAVAAVVAARRLLRLTIGRLEHLEGADGKVPPFWKVPLFGDDSVGYRHVWTSRKAECAGAGDQGR